MAAYYTSRVVGLPLSQWSMAIPEIREAVDGLLTMVKRRTERGLTSFLSELSDETELSRSQVRSLLRLARGAHRAMDLWDGFALDHDSSWGYRVFDRLDKAARTKVIGVIKTTETLMRHQVGHLADLDNATEVEHAIGVMAANRASDIAVLRQLAEA